MKINKISPLEHDYLQIVGSIAQSPKSLYFIGNLPKERITTVAIVGTRKPTRYGEEVTHMLAYELAKQGIVVVSGLALGVDAIAHKAALEAKGTTIAVLANGLPKICRRQIATSRKKYASREGQSSVSAATAKIRAHMTFLRGTESYRDYLMLLSLPKQPLVVAR